MPTIWAMATLNAMVPKCTDPNVNRLASEGIRFTNAHATAATSTPSRYSMLTGEYAWRRPGTDVAAGNAGMIIRPEDYTMADMFKNAGYATAAIGKWHLGLGDKAGEQDWNAPLPAALGDLGFDYSYIMAATADRVPCVFIENGRLRITIRVLLSRLVTGNLSKVNLWEKIIPNCCITRSTVMVTIWLSSMVLAVLAI